MPPAVDIDDVIAFAPTDIGNIAFGTASFESLYTQMQLWIAGLLGPSGIFPPANNETQIGQREITDWYAGHLKALDSIEGQGPGDAGVVGTSAVINVIERVAYAVKYAAIEGAISGAQQTAVVALYNDVWQ